LIFGAYQSLLRKRGRRFKMLSKLWTAKGNSALKKQNRWESGGSGFGIVTGLSLIGCRQKQKPLQKHTKHQCWTN